MNTMLRWIATGCGLCLPLVASVPKNPQRALMVAGYARQTSCCYVPSCIIDLVYQYAEDGRYTKVGDARKLTFRGMTMSMSLAPPALLVTLTMNLGKPPTLVVWDVQKDCLVFEKRYTTGACPDHMLCVPRRGQEDCVILCYTDHRLARLGLTSQKETFFAAKSACYADHLVLSPDGKGFVFVAGTRALQEMTYWEVDNTSKLPIQYACSHNAKAYHRSLLVSFIDADHFLVMPVRHGLQNESQTLYIYHRQQTHVVRRVNIPMASLYYNDAILSMGRWIVTATPQGFGVYDTSSDKKYDHPYAYEGGAMYRMLPLHESQCVLVTSHVRDDTIEMKAAICTLEEVNDSMRIRVGDGKVIDRAKRSDGVGYAMLVVLGGCCLGKNYNDRSFVLHRLW